MKNMVQSAAVVSGKPNCVLLRLGDDQHEHINVGLEWALIAETCKRDSLRLEVGWLCVCVSSGWYASPSFCTDRCVHMR